tara:strand:+ start:37 stop:738 length:702 start_codon:yes stop_codon:yes gene_type:complete
MDIIAIVPARSKSKGISNKNITILGGKPLIGYTFEAAKKSAYIKRIILTTDSKKYAEMANNIGVEAPFLRPNSLSGDNVPMLPVIRHTIDYLKNNENYYPKHIILLTPTCPLRTENHIDEAIIKYKKNNVDVLVSVIDVPHNMVPESIMINNGKNIELYDKGDPIFNRQKKKKYFARNGPAILIMNTDYLMQCKHFYEGNVIPYVMKHKDSIDIDEYEDIIAAERIINESISV